MKQPIHEFEIRRALLDALHIDLQTRTSGGLVEELGVCQGLARMDVAVLGEEFTGYEIKSDVDTLKRLDKQIGYYEGVFEKVVLVTTKRHLEKSSKKIPDWWGLTLAERVGDVVELQAVRLPTANPNLKPEYLVQLLWREEAIRLLDKLNNENTPKRVTKKQVWDQICGRVSCDELVRLTVDVLLSRPNWRSVG